MESAASIPFNEENALRYHDPSTETPVLVIVPTLAAAAFMLFSPTALAESRSVLLILLKFSTVIGF